MRLVRLVLPLVALAIVAAATIASQCCIGSLCLPLG